jgi:hypothetical protein
MVGTQRGGLSSAFDDMLVQSKKRFDDLYRGGGPAGVRASSALHNKVSTSTSPAAVGADSPAVRRLNQRFGTDWRFEVAEQQREGDEAIVLCKVFLGKSGAVRTQFGRAKISDGPVAGESGGLKFTLESTGDKQDERDAFRRATEAALMNCADLA